MKPWKLVLGAAAACAACCAAPLVGGMAALGIGSGLFAGVAGLVASGSGAWLPLAAGGAALAIGATALAWHRRRSTSDASACGCPEGPTGAPACATTRR